MGDLIASIAGLIGIFLIIVIVSIPVKNSSKGGITTSKRTAEWPLPLHYNFDYGIKSEGCDYCKSGKDLLSNVHTLYDEPELYDRGQIGASVNIMDKKLMLDDCDFGTCVTNIKFCPKCGRKL
ncbi:hypothetical protein [Companilactobacillus nodensis]|uniref:Uncharacterized protein n=1 Tax=Companilactobacillus nodensis DSM 19682 = JCM 14932 = NBRC 107160 TaxID=1423775 RepID=A0A0R1K800_9LACO|nr:hypothetical protein [Companilactobacillus nodensis]KRK79467.1 hypothetical protein FD03_GL000597 [Companilactobacillus nodensis DSM 19682 = JCM 14932 = NBRC 107160]